MAIKNSTLGLHAEIATADPLFPTSNDRAVTVVYLHNKSGSAVNVDVYAVPTGLTPGVGNKIYGELLITAGDTYIVDTEKMILADGDAIYASSDTEDAVVATVSYIEI